MKKLLSFALCVTAVSAFAASTETVLGQVGVTAITNSLKNAIVAVSYDDLAGGSGMVVSNFVKTTNLTTGDQLAIFNNGEGAEIYDTWVLEENERGVKYWAKNAKTFTVDADGQLKEGTGLAASGVTNAVGTGIWLVRQNPMKDGKVLPFYIYGKPVVSPTSKTVADTWTLIGNPTQGTVEIAAARFGADELSDGDEIVIPVAPSGDLSRYTYSLKFGWRTTDAEGKWVKTSPSLDEGLGCWIRTTKAASINWISK